MAKKISRNQFLRWGLLGGTGAIAAIVISQLINRSPVTDSEEEVISPEPTPATSGEYSFEVITVNSLGEIINTSQQTANQEVLDLGQGVNLELVYIPAGTLTVGSPNSEKGRDPDESPQTEITLAPFWIGKYPITQAQYAAMIGENPSYFAGDDLPVESVSWNDAIKFCEAISQKLGQEFRLPSEAQWEYACRAGTTTPFAFGPTLTTDVSNYNGSYTYAQEPEGQFRNRTSPVGSFSPNAFGLYDMHGLVWEWCQDDYQADLSQLPSDGSPWVNEEETNPRKSRRGGSWDGPPETCRSANRLFNLAENSYNFIGFRVIKLA